jgi:5-aminolevulinate synthase
LTSCTLKSATGLANLEWIVGNFPRAIWRDADTTREITVWCSNGYLGMGQYPDVIAAMHDASSRMGSGAGGTRACHVVFGLTVLG